MSDLNHQVIKAAKWSTLTEISAKLIVPITSMVLARLLTPEVFGVVTTLAMVTSFAGLFTDAGFHNYIVQHEFKDESDCKKSANVAFWSNLALSVFIWGIIVVFAEPLAVLVGNPGLGFVLIVASLSIPLGAFSSIQSALFKRQMDFQTLFKIRLVSVIIPIVITIPLAYWLRNYWALVCGGLVQSLVSVILLFFFSNWFPRFYYSFKVLREMISFTSWTLIEKISIWLTLYVDVFIVGIVLNPYYLGLYKTSSTVVGSITSLITAATTPVLFTALSRLQNNEREFNELFFKFQKIVGMLVIPISVGLFCFSDLVTLVLLGEQWYEASGYIGLWCLTSGVTIVISHYSSEVYRAKGYPKLSVLGQLLHIAFLWPVVLIAVRYGFETLYVSRSLVRLQGPLVSLILMKYFIHISPWQLIKNIIPAIVASMPMFPIAFIIRQYYDDLFFQILSIVICSLAYIVIIYLFTTERHIINTYLQKK